MTLVDKKDNTAIFLAAEYDNYPMLKVLYVTLTTSLRLYNSFQLLLRAQGGIAKALVNKANRYNITPLHIASEKGYKDIVKVNFSQKRIRSLPLFQS